MRSGLAWTPSFCVMIGGSSKRAFNAAGQDPRSSARNMLKLAAKHRQKKPLFRPGPLKEHLFPLLLLRVSVPLEEAPAPARSSEGAPVSTVASEEVPAPTSSPKGAPASTALSEEAKEKNNISRKYEAGKSGPPVVPEKECAQARFSEGVPVHTVASEEAPVPSPSPEGVPVPTASSKEAPVTARSPERALRPNRFPEKVAVPIRSFKRAPGLAIFPHGAPRKRLCTWSTGALYSVDVVQPPPHKKTMCGRRSHSLSKIPAHFEEAVPMEHRRFAGKCTYMSTTSTQEAEHA
ncbi:Zonadhesin [Labeo rohita]|uniref:Zonadhesin n=1 Tax=Labeo rohita TaxID=84645 RepID=A0ABQ8L2N4_LABRO|nr:Zonadhesin [Labeo rohita]